MSEVNYLSYRRQFLLGPIASTLNGWKSIEVTEALILSVHPDLGVTVAEENDRKVILLGYVIDPYSPNRGNEHIVNNLLAESKNFDEIIEKTLPLSGRWIIIYISSTETKLFHDPCGMRKVFYSFKDGFVYCGSQPNILTTLSDFKKSSNPDLSVFLESEYYENEERPWFGDGTIFEGIKHLTPNHYLDLQKKKVKRYWVPLKENKGINEVVEDASELLKGSLKAINYRHEVMLPVTAGWDSRVLLAASKGIKEDIYYFVSTMNTLSDNHIDIRIPSALSEKLGLNLEVVDNLAELRPEFTRILEGNITRARVLPKTLTIQYFYDNLSNMVNINGNMSEIARNPYGTKHPRNISAKYIMKKLGCPSNLKYVEKALDIWLKNAKEVSNKYNIDLMDLFHWEQHMGNWGTMYQSEQDIAIEEFTPFNNRELLLSLLSVNKEYRSAPDFKFYNMIIENLWPETLEAPINPTTLGNRIKKVIISALPVKVKTILKSKYVAR